MEMFEKKYALALTVRFNFQSVGIYTGYYNLYIPNYVQVVVGTLVIVTLGGSMGIVFYASSIFKVAGKNKGYFLIHILIL